MNTFIPPIGRVHDIHEYMTLFISLSSPWTAALANLKIWNVALGAQHQRLNSSYTRHRRPYVLCDRSLAWDILTLSMQSSESHFSTSSEDWTRSHAPFQIDYISHCSTDSWLSLYNLEVVTIMLSWRSDLIMHWRVAWASSSRCAANGG